jgi:hypothetical protein
MPRKIVSSRTVLALYILWAVATALAFTYFLGYITVSVAAASAAASLASSLLVSFMHVREEKGLRRIRGKQSTE